MLTVLTACGYKLPPEPSPWVPTLPAATSDAERQMLGGRSPEWGLALSGGGLRSALFSVGALKAMYDAGLLERMDIVSSVSGGGYAAYWLYSQHDPTAAAAQPFGHRRLASEVYSRELCSLITSGKFYTNWRAVRRAVSPFPPSFPRDYMYALQRTFGIPADRAGTVQLHTLGADTAAHRAPYLIVNSTLRSPRAQAGYVDGLFELTAAHAGNAQYGYHEWDGSSIPLVQAVAASGAAVSLALKQSIESPSDAYPGSTITLSDGGHSENLGAAALIRRRVKHIVVVDAEHDPAYTFGSYVKLKERFRAHGVRIEVPTIDAFLGGGAGRSLSSSLHMGRVSIPGGEELRLYYIKMSLPDSYSDGIRRYRSDSVAVSRDSATVQTYFANCVNPPAASNGRWAGVDIHNVALYRYASSNYAEYLNGDRPVLSRLGGFLTYRFPHTTTGDQSFYLDQSLAFVGLGFLQTQELVNAVAASGQR